MKPMVRDEIDEISWVEIKTIIQRRKEEAYVFVFEFINAIQIILKEMRLKESKDNNNHHIMVSSL